MPESLSPERTKESLQIIVTMIFNITNILDKKCLFILLRTHEVLLSYLAQRLCSLLDKSILSLLDEICVDFFFFFLIKLYGNPSSNCDLSAIDKTCSVKFAIETLLC